MKNDETKTIINEAVNNLFRDIQQGKSERLEKYLAFTAQFHNYSMSNTFMIYAQFPEASRVAGYVQWQKLGHQVNKGSKAIKILAPQKYTYIDEDGERVFFSNMSPEQREDKERHGHGTTFKIVNVFDISQCKKLINDSGQVERYFYNIGDNFKGAYESLRDIIQGNDIKVIETNTGSAEGISFGGEIHIKFDLEFNNKLLTLIHEFAHEILHHGSESQDTYTRPVRECQAEATSFIVSHYLGLKNPFSSDYILNWVETKEELKENLETIIKASNEIIEKIENYKSKLEV